MNAESVKARLKNRSKETGKTLQELLTLYGLERTIYRLSISEYKKNFTLKGGIFLYAVFNGDYARSTTDIDFLAQGTSNDISDVKKMFTEVFGIATDDPLVYDLNSLNVKAITEFKKYHGVNVSCKAYLDRTEIGISIDIGFGDVIYPQRIEMEFPTVLSDERPQVYAYSLCSSIAEKFEAIVSLGEDNSRFKDFYDIVVLSDTYDFAGQELSMAVKETFEYRKTSLDEIVAFDSGFSEDKLRQSRWNSFVKKKKTMIPIALNETIESVKAFLGPIRDALLKEEVFTRNWSHDRHKWV